MKLSKDDLIEGYVKQVRNKVGNFDCKVQTSALLFNFFKNKGYKFSFCPKISPKNKSIGDFKTPDFHAHKDDHLDIIGEIKQSLPSIEGSDYEKKVSK